MAHHATRLPGPAAHVRQDTPPSPLQEAASLLQQHLSEEPWLVAVRAGDITTHPHLIVYVTAPRKAKGNVPQRWHNYPVKIEKMSRPQPAMHPKEERPS